MKKRNIPAYAGKTRASPIRPIGTAEHPRVCGENATASVYLVAADGTSPRMRGKQSHGIEYLDNERNIPAYAGKTSWMLVGWLGLSEHPRVCGENAY